MLSIRFKPVGRKHSKSYRIVLAQKSSHVTKKFIEILGWYNPYTKDSSLNKERIQHWLSHNVEMSESVTSLFKKNELIK
jgi:ribosomal protein S16